MGNPIVLKLINHLILFFSFLSFSFGNLSTIKGIITNSENKEPLIGANIMLMDTNFGIASDTDGFYMIANVPMGKYTLNAMFMGYESLKKDLWIEAGQEYVIDISLKPSAIKLQETKVTAEKRKGKITEAPASMEIISTREIKGKIATNMGAYLKGLKGVDFTSSGINNYSISIRGFNSSFNTRVLTLTDGRVANMPALRVINYSAIPQSMDDIDRMEVILGPATALYGANAHSGVVNIVSKSPAHSEGLTMSASGSQDERQLRKINGRWSKKLSNKISMKLSGMYLHAHEWPYVSETEYKSHLYPWSGNPQRTHDGKDNNPWNSSNEFVTKQTTNDGREVMIGNGEPNHGDLDGDGVAGEDWFNGYDDDGDGLIDEDYFTANGLDDDDDGVVDEGIDESSDKWTDGYDNDGNGQIDDGLEMFTNEASSNFDPNWSHNIEQKNILIKGGRSVLTIHGEPNPWYIEGVSLAYSDLKGDYYFDEDKVEFMFDVYIYDFGEDGIQGDPFIDMAGDNTFQMGERLTQLGGFDDANDCGLDGICPGDLNYTCADADGTEGDGIWQPGDGWVDDGDGIVNLASWGEPSQDTYVMPNENDYMDVWPPKNGIWNEGEEIIDENNDGIFIPMDAGENDNIFDTGDGIYGFKGEQWTECNEDLSICNDDPSWNESMGNGIWNQGEEYIDTNGDGQYTPPDYVDDFQHVSDMNGDGLNDYPDFEVENHKMEFRLDYDLNKNTNMTYQGGYAWTKTQQVTGTSRYLADGFEYTYHQIRGRHNDWYAQFYTNQSFSGKTRSYNEGKVIHDKSKNYAFQIQKNSIMDFINTKLVWGLDYFKTLPSTNGSILNDGPNGYDNDGDNDWLIKDGIDNDGDGLIDEKKCADGLVTGIFDGEPDSPGIKDGIPWKCGEGIDEKDEYDNPISNEYGFYFQTKTELFGTSRFELITAARLDKHDLLDEGLQFSPKLGFIYKPNERSSFRITYGKAFNTPNAITLYTDLFIRKQGILDVYLRGNKDGTPYCRVGESCSGSEDITISNPGFYYTNNNGDSLFNTLSSFEDTYFSGFDGSGCEVDPYSERVNGAPYFFNIQDEAAPKDMIPLDTSRYLIYIPELNGDGILYSPEESFNIPNIDPIKTEKIQTLELGFKGFLGNRTQLSMDYYLSYYEDFFSPPTFITPIVVLRDDPSLSIQGILPVNDFNSNPPYGTAWNGKDDDGDWVIWASEFGWDQTDLDGNCPPNPTVNDPCWADPGEWGFINYPNIHDSSNYIIYHPQDVMVTGSTGEFKYFDPQGNPINAAFFDAVGVDEYKVNGLNESEMISMLNTNGENWKVPGVAYAPPHLVLSPMNYGNVWMQGLDMSITHMLPEFNLILNGNISWYGTTKFYNKLTKKNDPINAPEWKWNGSIKWASPIGEIGIHYRHVNEFTWNDGIWSGIIGPYDIFDFYYNYLVTKNLKLSMTALNFMNDEHKELIGGAKMGQQIIMRLTSTF